MAIILLPSFLYALLRTLPVQNYLTDRATQYLSKELGTTVEVGGIDISWFLKLTLVDVKILDKHQNLLLSVHELSAGVETISLKHKQLMLQSVLLNRADFNLVTYKSDSTLNLQFIIDYFSSSDTTPSTAEPWSIGCRNLKLKNSHFMFRDERYMQEGPGMDYSDLDMSRLNLDIRNLRFAGDTILADIREIQAYEKCGFNLQHFSAQALVSPRGFSTKSLKVNTDKSELSLDLTMLYDDWNAFNYFIDSVTIISSINPSELDMRDIVCYAPDIQGMHENFRLSGNVKGQVSSFSGKDMSIAYGNGTHFSGDVKMSGLPDFEETFMHVKMQEFRTNATDIGNFSLPQVPGSEDIAVPEQIASLGSIIVKGRFTGFYNDFVSNATFYTEAGNVATDILLSNNLSQHIIEYKGHIQASDLDLGKIFSLEDIGMLSLDASVDGKGFNADNADLTFTGTASDVGLLGNSLNNAAIDGKFRDHTFSGILDLRDELVKLHFNGSVDISDSMPAFDFKADLENARLSLLHLWDRDSSSTLTTHMDLNFRGNNLDNLLGNLKFENTLYSEGGKLIRMKNLDLETSMMGDGKRMTLLSDYADADFAGQYTFDDLSEYLTIVFTDYLPALSIVAPSAPRLAKGRFDYSVHLKNTEPVTSIFIPGLMIDPNTVVKGGFNPTDGLIDINSSSPFIHYNGITFHEFSLKGKTIDGEMRLNVNCNSMDFSDQTDKDKSAYHFDNLNLSSVAKNDSIRFSLNWNNNDTLRKNLADINGLVSFSGYPCLMIKLDSASVTVNDTSWRIIPDNSVLIDSTSIEINHFGFTYHDQSILVDGRITHDPLDKMDVNFNNFNVSQFDELTKPMGIDFDGFLTGNLSMADIYNVPLITSSLVVKKMGFNHEKLGDAEVISSWDTQKNAIEIDSRIAYQGNTALHYPLLIKGAVYPEREHNNFDLGITIDNIKLAVLQPFFDGIFSRMRGWGSGNLTLRGDFEDPVLAGKVKLMRAEFLVDYLRTTYSFAGEINFDKDIIWYKDIPLADSIGNTGQTSGTIKHHAFGSWNLDIDVKANDLTVLNTTYSPDEMYYGKVKAKGSMSLKGPINDLKMVVKAASSKGTEVYIPINYSVNISENDYIFYVHADTASDEESKPVIPSNLSLQMGLEVTKDANLEIILPYRMGNIKAKGDGLVDMGIDTRGDYTMHGQYIMDKGSFLFNFQNIFSRNFEIMKGSSITFNGSPYDADINMQAVYKIKTTLAGLSSVPAEVASKRIPVDCIISLSNSLYNPEIKFNIAMPDADAETQRMVYGAIDTSNSVNMNQQMISLLVLNSFTSTIESSGITASGLGISSFSVISSQLNNWLSKISKDFDIGVNYRPGDQMSAQELELALSTQLFNDRVVLDGTFGMSTNTNPATTANQNANQWIGDVNVEVKITEDGRFRVKAFNRTNTSLDLYSGQSPYTQGVGILYRKDFDKFRDLFRKQKKIIITD